MELDEDPDVIPEQIETDDPDAYLEATEEQLEEAIDKVLSDDTPLDAAIKAANAAKVKRVLEVETDLAEDPDALLEMDEECLKKIREISYGVPFQGLSLSQKPSRENVFANAS
ncbi:hypothetical protein CFD26_108329 [Aspergillus turcosus]|uniref:Uncharacterized protein n=1 Tax=Aspergillus turcosus TaxID=1245748 RepID=A0A3R7M1X0_9EURO|nr:hypothetical protein CFD26_108329 [Aspergillus turcosus]